MTDEAAFPNSAPTQQPCVVLLQEPGSELRKVELREFGAIRDALGSDVLTAFCCCFVHMDRLTSTISCMQASESVHRRDSHAFARNLLAMVWYTVGTLRELAKSISAVKAALAKRERLDPASPSWLTLRDIEARWNRDSFFRGMRDQIAFHVDGSVIEKGLELLTREQNVLLLESDGIRSDQAHWSLALSAQFEGLGLDPAKYQDFIEQVYKDHSAIRPAVETAFFLALKSAGVPYGTDATA